MKAFIAASFLTAMTILGGCTAPPATGGFAFDDAKGKGLLAGSLTAENVGNFFSQDVYIYFDPADPNSKLPRVGVSVNNHCSPSDFGLSILKPCTDVFAFVVPAGDYVFDEWHIKASGVLSPEHWHGPKITIQAGKVTYVGNIDMVFDPAFTGDEHAWIGWPRAADQSARDIPILLQRLPHIGAADIVMQPLTLDPRGPVCSVGTAVMITLTSCGH